MNVLRSIHLTFLVVCSLALTAGCSNGSTKALDPVTTTTGPAVSGPATTETLSTPEQPTTTALDPTQAPDLRCDGWQLVFVDNFDEAEIDPDRWNVYDYPGHANNGLRHPSAVTVEDGLLTITAKEVDGVLISGGLATRYSQTYGRFEVRVRAEPDPNALTSAVILTWPASNNWPAEGENNIYETGPGSSRRPFSSFIHFPDGTEGGSHIDYTHQASGTEWHEMVMEWDANQIGIWRDGLRAMHVTDASKIPDMPHVMTAQLDAMRTAPFEGEVKMEVDWMRIYEPIEPPSGC